MRSLLLVMLALTLHSSPLQRAWTCCWSRDRGTLPVRVDRAWPLRRTLLRFASTSVLSPSVPSQLPLSPSIG